jgi:hypothetical protein
MGFAAGTVPVWMRVGDGREVNVGSLALEAEASTEPGKYVDVLTPPWPKVLRDMADAMEADEAGAVA